MLKKDGRSIKQHLEGRGLVVLNLLHFAQSLQQRAIYPVNPRHDEVYFRSTPKHRG